MLSWIVRKNFQQTEPQKEGLELWSVEVETVTPSGSAQDLINELEKVYGAIVTYLQVELLESNINI